jgi:hypothetical protein
VVAQAAGMLGLQLAAFGEQPVDVVEFDRNSGGDQTVGGVRREDPRPLLVPPKLG